MTSNNTKSKKVHGIFKASIIVSLIVVCGKLFGFLRDAIIAAYYGATWQTDAFFFAQSMPSMIFPAICGSLSTAFISLYITRRVEQGEKEGDRFASRMLITTLGIALVISGVAIVFTPWFVPILAPGFTEIQIKLAVWLTRLTLGAFVLTMAQYMLSAILNSKKMFYGAQIAGLGYNLTVIILTLALGRGQSMDALTLTVILGSIIQVIILIALSWRNFTFTLRINPFHNESKTLLKLAFPILLGNSIVQINNIVDKLLASLLESGSISALSYSSSLNRLVTGVFITTLSTVIYPSLSESLANRNVEKFKHNLLQSLGLLPLIILPISIITIIQASDIVSIVYKRGNFDVNATILTTSALTFYAGMYVFSSVQEVIIRGFYALKDTKTPMINAAIAVISNSVFSVFLVRIMGIGGIALGTTISTGIATVILLFSIKRKIPDLKLSSLIPTIIKIIISALVMIVVLLLIRKLLSDFLPYSRFIIVTITGISIYTVTLILLKCKELMILFTMLKQRVRSK